MHSRNFNLTIFSSASHKTINASSSKKAMIKFLNFKEKQSKKRVIFSTSINLFILIWLLAVSIYYFYSYYINRSQLVKNQDLIDELKNIICNLQDDRALKTLCGTANEQVICSGNFITEDTKPYCNRLNGLLDENASSNKTLLSFICFTALTAIIAAITFYNLSQPAAIEDCLTITDLGTVRTLYNKFTSLTLDSKQTLKSIINTLNTSIISCNELNLALEHTDISQPLTDTPQKNYLTFPK